MNKFDASALRFRQHALELKAARRHIVFLPEYVPTTVPATVKKKTAPVAAKGPMCTARTLEGRQCNFKASAGGCFCKKHSSMV
jgi:hypothetical protein